MLAVTILREGFEWALAHSALSHHDPDVDATYDDWSQRKRAAPVRIQWDPERSLTLAPRQHRAIQVGLGGEAVGRYVDHWTTQITDVTALAHDVHRAVAAGDLTRASQLLPSERPYPLTPELGARIGVVEEHPFAGEV